MLIRVKRIYNFLLFHASFVMLSNVFNIILHNFNVFYRTNLLTRCPVLVSCFCCFCISENLPQEIFSECAGNLRGVFIRQKTPKDQRATWGPSTGQGRPAAAAWAHPTGGTRPCPWGASSASLDAYKLPHDLKRSRRPLFSREVTPIRRHHKS